MAKPREEKAASFRECTIFKEIDARNNWTYRLEHRGKLVARDRSFKYLNQIMYQIG